MQLYSYVVARDYGFAPNPFFGTCTLATCKPPIRKGAKIGDWVIGTGAVKRLNIPGELIYAMRVTEKMTFNDYWADPRFQVKKARMNGSRKQSFGDNIYHFVNGVWQQANSHHSLHDGSTNHHNLNRDTSQPYVLLSTDFYYFGSKHVTIPQQLRAICVKTQGCKKRHDPALVTAFITWLRNNHTPGAKDNPLQFGKFERYDGL